MADYAGLNPKTISRYLKEFEEEYKCENGIVVRKK